jgi:predicted ATPase
MLCRLGIFAGSFGIDAVKAVVADVETRPSVVAERLASLVSKSLVTATAVGADIAYRLLDTTRAYALDKLARADALNATARRHALYYQGYLAPRAAGEAVVVRDETAQHDLLANLRAALRWSFSDSGDSRIGAELAAVSSILFYQIGLVGECGDWTGRAIAALDDSTRGGRLEIELQSACGHAMNYSARSLDESLAALRRTRELARDLPARDWNWKILWADVFILTWEGDLGTALTHAQAHEAVTRAGAGPSNLAMLDIMIGNLEHLVGDQAASRTRYEAVVKRSPAPRPDDVVRTELGARVNSVVTLARIYWIQGFADKALAAARQAIDEARIIDTSSLTISATLLGSVPVLVWVGDLPAAMKTVESVIAATERDSIIRIEIQAKIWQAKLAILNGETDAGVSALRAVSEVTDPDRSQRRTYVSSLADGLARQGNVDEALVTLDTVITEIERHGGSVYMPEILRKKGEILASAGDFAVREAEKCFRQSSECARRQSALAFELQAAISLARLLVTQDRLHEALSLLDPVYARFTEGFGTADLIEARHLLGQLRAPASATMGRR